MKPKKIAKSYNRNYGMVQASNSKGHVPRQKRRNVVTIPNGKSEARTFYTFVIRTISGDWRYVTFRDHMLCTSNDIDYANCFSSVDETMRDLWKRVAIDDAIEWDEAVDPASFRLVKVNIGFEDATPKVFNDSGDHKQNMRYALLNCLSAQEAKLLGLEHEYAKAKLFTNNDPEEDDRNILTHLRDSSGKGDTGELLQRILD